MNKRSSFLTFLTALCPGVGYMYLGLIRRGVEALTLFIIIPAVLGFIGLGFLKYIFVVPFWFYTFFDTMNMASRIDKGEFILDNGFIFKDGKNINFDFKAINNGGIKVVAWSLIIIGLMALVNKIFGNTDIYYQVKNYLGKYLLPVIFIGLGVYILIGNKSKRD